MKRLLAMAILAVSASTAHAGAIVDVTKIAGKSEDDVSAYLGQPSSCGNIKYGGIIRYGKKCQYLKGETEIVFIKGKADWITVSGIDQIPFSKSALSAIGLKEAHPSFSNPDYLLR